MIKSAVFPAIQWIVLLRSTASSYDDILCSAPNAIDKTNSLGYNRYMLCIRYFVTGSIYASFSALIDEGDLL